MPNQFDPNSYAKGRPRGSNKQGTGRSHSQPLRAWKGIADRLAREAGEMAPAPEPTPRRRPRRKTIKLWKDPGAVERGRKGAATRKANAPQRAAKSEHERRSDAAKRGWAKIPPAERSDRALRGWETRDMLHGRTRTKRDNQRYLEDQQRLEKSQKYGRRRRDSGAFSHLPRGDAPYSGKTIF